MKQLENLKNKVVKMLDRDARKLIAGLILVIIAALSAVFGYKYHLIMNSPAFNYLEDHVKRGIYEQFYICSFFGLISFFQFFGILYFKIKENE